MHILTKTPRVAALLMACLTWLSCGRDARDLSTTAGALTSPISSTSASNDDTTVTYVVTYTGAHQYFRVYADTDRAAGTGLRIGGVGADFLVEDDGLYRYTGDGSSWSWKNVTTVSFGDTGAKATWRVSRADLGETNACTESADLLFDIDDVDAPKVTQMYTAAATCGGGTPAPTPTPTPTPSTPPPTASGLAVVGTSASNDAQTVAYQLAYTGSPAFWRVYVDTDRNAATGFAAGPGIGAEYLLENGSIYKHAGSGWSWSAAGSAGFGAQSGRASWSVSRSAIGETACGATATLLFQVEDASAHLVGSSAIPEALTDAMTCNAPPPTPTPTPTPAPTPTPTPAPTPTPTPTPTPPPTPAPGGTQIKYVFVIAMENESAEAIYGNSSAPYINGQLIPKYAHATAFGDPLPDSIPSEPHYVWMEAGTNAFSDVTFTGDGDPSSRNSTNSTAHLTTQMKAASPAVSWLSFQEGLDSSTGACPIHSSGFYAAKHDPFIFFQDVAGSPPSASNADCAAHHRAFTSAAFADALSQRTVAQYNFISPNVCNDMHGDSSCPRSDDIRAGDDWLAANLPPLIDFVNANAGVVFLVWDEPEGGSGLIPFLAIGPHVKTNYAGHIAYDHGSVTKSVEEIFQLPLLPTVTSSNDFADLFQPGFFP